MILVTKWFGCFLCDENRILEKRLFPKDANIIAEKLALMQRGGTLPEEQELVEGKSKMFVTDRRQALLGKPMLFDSSFITAEMFGYSTDLRSKTQGRGNYSMEVSFYDEVPKNISDAIVSKNKGE